MTGTRLGYIFWHSRRAVQSDVDRQKWTETGSPGFQTKATLQQQQISSSGLVAKLNILSLENYSDCHILVTTRNRFFLKSSSSFITSGQWSEAAKASSCTTVQVSAKPRSEVLDHPPYSPCAPPPPPTSVEEAAGRTELPGSRTSDMLSFQSSVRLSTKIFFRCGRGSTAFGGTYFESLKEFGSLVCIRQHWWQDLWAHVVLATFLWSQLRSGAVWPGWWNWALLNPPNPQPLTPPHVVCDVPTISWTYSTNLCYIRVWLVLQNYHAQRYDCE